MSRLAILALILIPVTAFLLYAVFADSREKKILEANRRMDAAIAAYEKGEVEMSLQALEEIRNGFGGLDTAKVAKYYEGAILFGLEEDEKSLEYMESFLSDSPQSFLKTESLFMAGFSSFRLRKWDKAVMYFEELLSIGTKSHEKRVLPLLGAAYFRAGNREKAEAVYERFITVFPKADIYSPEPASEKPE